MEKELSRLDKAIILAVRAHSGQLDKKGLPVILHPISVMELMQTESERIIAILHDVEEDTDITIDEIDMEVGLTKEEKIALMALNHHKNEPYVEYIMRIKNTSQLAIFVKIADVIRNSSPTRLEGLPEETVNRLKKKYDLALAILSNGILPSSV